MTSRRPRSLSPMGVDSSHQHVEDKKRRPVALNGISSTVEDKTNDFLCPICFDVMREAHITRCGHTFCYECIQKSIITTKHCPKCNVVLSSSDSIFPNYLLDELISKHNLTMQLQDGLNAASVDGVGPDGLKSFLTNESQRLSLTDVNIMLEILTQRKQLLEAESSAAQNQLLYEFLNHLLRQKEDQQAQITKEISLVKKDLESVSNILSSVSTSKSHNLKSDHTGEGGSGEKHVSISKLEAFNTIFEGVLDTSSRSSFLSRKRRMYSHFDDFVSSYFSTRSHEMYLGAGAIPMSEENEMKGTRQGLDAFRDNLVKFSRYSSLRPLATMHYSTDLHISSTIVSTIVFDKDNEYFAIGGVTKRIKIYDYLAVVRDTVDIHYPCVEMISKSKISCIAWNSYHKNILASSDYEGAVNIWDVTTSKLTKCFQEHEKRCWSVDFNEVDTRLIVSGSDDARVKLWSLKDEHSIATLEAKANVCCVKFNPKISYQLAFGSADHDVHFYDLRNLSRAICVFKGHKKAVSYVKFLNAHEIVSASTDSQLKLWNVNNPPYSLRSFTGHVNEKNFVGLANDGDYIACGSEDNSLFVYYKGLSKPLFSKKIEVGHSVSDLERSTDVNEFVSAVCWRKQCNVVLAANSRGLINILELVSGAPKANKARLFWGLGDKHDAVSVVGINTPSSYSPLECINAENEVIRIAAAIGVKNLIAQDIMNIDVEPFERPECSAVGAYLSTYKYQELKSAEKQTPEPKINLAKDADGSESWKRGKILAKAQNFTRCLMETPANLMTPTIFAEKAKAQLSKNNVDCVINDAKWAKELGMNSFLSVSHGSDEPPLFLEITYSQGEPKDPSICLVGKGVTFDAGGISIKPAANMADMRADMGGAANVVGAILAISQLNLPVNIKGLIPLTENLINGRATKPGDVVKAMNGKSICVDNTDAEGRLILADALCYSEKFKPKFVVDIATLTGAIVVALGNCVAGAFCNNDQLWANLQAASADTGDRMWRMPLFSHYTKQITDYEGYDIHNTGKKGGGPCTAAAFLKEFVPKDTPWVHIDMAGVMSSCDDQIYTHGKIMPGRPMRTLVELVSRYSKK